MATGDIHSLALHHDGTLWAWGYNYDGQLGDGTNDNRNTPVQVKGLDGIDFFEDTVAIDASGFSSMALKSDGTVWTWGNNENGQLGNSQITTAIHRFRSQGWMESIIYPT